MKKVFSWAGGKVLEIDVPGYEDWLPQLIDQFESNQSQVTKSHKIKGRWENWYLDIESVPEARNPIRFARDVGREIFKTSSVILFDSFPGLDSPHPLFGSIVQNLESLQDCMTTSTMRNFQAYSIFHVS